MIIWKQRSYLTFKKLKLFLFLFVNKLNLQGGNAGFINSVNAD